MAISNAYFIILFVPLASVSFCHNDHHNHHQDFNWIYFIPGLEHFLRNVTTSTPNYEDYTFKMQDIYIPEGEKVDESAESSTIQEIMNGSGSITTSSSSTSSGVYIGIPIGGICILLVFCYCCYKCCCGRCGSTTNVTTNVIQPQQATLNPPPTQIIVQQVHAPAPTIPQQYPPIYEMGYPSQQHWNQFQPQPPHYSQPPHYNQPPPMNQHFQQQPPHNYYPDTGHPTAPPHHEKF